MNKKLVIIVTLAFTVVSAVGVALWMRGADERLLSELEADHRPADAIPRLRRMVEHDPSLLLPQQWLLRLEIETGDLNSAQKRLNLPKSRTPVPTAPLQAPAFSI